jgi:hypothetical protein
MNNKKNIGGLVNNESIGLVGSRLQTRAEQNPVKLPDLYDNVAIRAQREALRAEEIARAKQPRN